MTVEIQCQIGEECTAKIPWVIKNYEFYCDCLSKDCLMRSAVVNTLPISNDNRLFCMRDIFLLARDFRLSILSHNLLPPGYHEKRNHSPIWRQKISYLLKKHHLIGVTIMQKHNSRYVLHDTIKNLIPLHFLFFKLVSRTYFPGNPCNYNTLTFISIPYLLH